ncbi:conserved hypothetical protein [Carnobacterium divergens]|nr:conserved hypothetical protein [Carnobacterium divergens]
MKVFSKYLGIGSITFFALLVINTLWKLFHLSRNSSSYVTTLFGITINNKISDDSISTTFGLTIQTLIVYITFTIFVLLIGYSLKQWKINKGDEG